MAALRPMDRRPPAKSAFAAAISPGAAPPLTASGLWPVPVVVFSALLISWAAEVAEFFVSQGLALAVLAFLQVLPEFAVEAAIAHNAAQNPSLIELVTANFTGSNRLLVGVGLPLVFFLAALASRRRKERLRAIELRPDHSVEVLFLLLPTAYMAAPYLRGALGPVDSAVLASMFGLYLWILGRLPPEPEEAAETVPGVAGVVLTKSVRIRKTFVLGGFLGGGFLLFLAAEPFLGAMMGVAAVFGIPAFFFVQWLAPALSEFPEFIAASRWALQTKTATAALVNILSAKVNQWTLLVAMIPMVFSISLGRVADVPLGDIHGIQRVELLLTAAQSLAAVAIFLKMRITALDAGLLFGLWFFQFVEPGLREETIPVYLAFALFEVVRHRKELRLFSDFRKVVAEHATHRP